MVQGSPSPIEGGGDNLLLLQEIFVPPVSCVGNGQPSAEGDEGYCQKFYEKPLCNIPKDNENPPPCRRSR